MTKHYRFTDTGRFPSQQHPANLPAIPRAVRVETWLACAEVLPELEAHPIMWAASRAVLVTTTDKHDGRTIATLEANEIGGADWVSETGYSLAGVTHWRDLPALPVRAREPATHDPTTYEVAP